MVLLSLLTSTNSGLLSPLWKIEMISPLTTLLFALIAASDIDLLHFARTGAMECMGETGNRRHRRCSAMLAVFM
jgi:hypothetical protein